MLSSNNNVHDIGEKACSISPSKLSILAILEVKPEGRIVTSSPFLKGRF
jgi:hypothetical protein